MNEIPLPLQKLQYKFCKVQKDKKSPFEKNWNTAAYSFNDTNLLSHLSAGGNAGIIAGYGNLRILDIDDKNLIDHFDNLLGDTLCIKTANKNRHYYFLSDYDQNHVLTDGGGEFRAKNMMVLIPGCIVNGDKKYIILNDKPIKIISKREVEELLKPYIADVKEERNNQQKPVDTTRSGREWEEVCRLLKKGKSKERIFEKMMAFKKWADGSEQYRELTYKKALEKIKESVDNKEDSIKDAKNWLNENIKELFIDQDGTPYVTIFVKGHHENLNIQSRAFINFITRTIYEQTGKPPSKNIISSLQSIFSANAMFEGKQHDVFLRCAQIGDEVYIDVGDKDWSTLKITAKEISIVHEPLVKFKRFRHMKQLSFDLDADIDDVNLIFEHIPVQEEDDKTLFKSYLALLFLEKVPTVILIIFGPQGSGKTMCLKLIRSLIDPSSLIVLSMPNDIKELVQQASHHYLPYYDNVSDISKPFSDFFCRAVTGEGYSKRELFTDDEDIIYNLRRKIAINGINLPGQEADFLDRCSTIHLARINKRFRRTEEDLWDSFEKDRPKIVGAILKIIQGTLQKVKDVKIEYLPRMADYAKWGEAASQVVGEESGKFTKIYFNRIGRLNKEAIEASPVGQCIFELMDSYDNWGGTSTELLEVLTSIAVTLKIDKNPKWPKGSQVLTKRINEITSNLEDEGIKFEFGHTGKRRFIKLTKETVNTVSSVKDVQNDTVSTEITQETNDNSTFDKTKEVLNGVSENITAITDNNTIENIKNTSENKAEDFFMSLKEDKIQKNNTINTKNSKEGI